MIGLPGPTLTQAERTARAEAGMIVAAIGLLNTVGIQGTTLVAIGDRAGYSPDRGADSHDLLQEHHRFRDQGDLGYPFPEYQV